MDESPKKQQKDLEDAGIVLQRPEPVPDQRFVHARKAMQWLLAAGFEARLAGGCVRDRILGLRPKDYDIATNALPEQVCVIFRQKNVKVVPTGIEHGTVTVVMAGQGLEITSLRKDVATDGRRAVVEFGNSFRDDAERRDFTMNALYEDMEGRVYDYFDGLGDLKRQELRFVGNPEARIKEDYLRILRLFRFWARYGFQPDPGTLNAVQKEVAGLKIISQERITSEILALLSEAEVLPALRAMHSSGVLTQILQVHENPPLEELDAYKIIRKAERANCRLAVLFAKTWEIGLLSHYLSGLRLSKLSIQQILSLCEVPCLSTAPTAPLAELMEILDQLEKAWPAEALLESALPAFKLLYPQESLLFATLAETEIKWGIRRRSPLPLNGQMLMKEFGLTPGPVLGSLMSQLKLGFRNAEWHTLNEGLDAAARLLAANK